MTLPRSIQEHVTTFLRSRTPGAAIKSFTFASGGCINSGGRLQTSEGDFFLKWNDAAKFPNLFETEAKGLKALAETKVIRVPQVAGCAIGGEQQFILMEFIHQHKPAVNFWQTLGEQLAELHRHSADEFGLDHANYIGSLPQINIQETNWITFFVNHRLSPQLDLILLSPGSSFRARFEKLFPKLPGLLPEEKPALLHGDLWSGNLIRDELGAPCFIDPAIYYGHREAELAFTELFGGFHPAFYESYASSFPLVPGYPERKDIYNLYPLLVHANLFGGGYVQQVEMKLRQFGC